MQCKKMIAPFTTNTISLAPVSLIENAQEQEDYHIEERAADAEINDEDVFKVGHME